MFWCIMDQTANTGKREHHRQLYINMKFLTIDRKTFDEFTRDFYTELTRIKGDLTPGQLEGAIIAGEIFDKVVSAHKKNAEQKKD